MLVKCILNGYDRYIRADIVKYILDVDHVSIILEFTGFVNLKAEKAEQKQLKSIQTLKSRLSQGYCSYSIYIVLLTFVDLSTCIIRSSNYNNPTTGGIELSINTEEPVYDISEYEKQYIKSEIFRDFDYSHRFIKEWYPKYDLEVLVGIYSVELPDKSINWNLSKDALKMYLNMSDNNYWTGAQYKQLKIFDPFQIYMKGVLPKSIMTLIGYYIISN